MNYLSSIMINTQFLDLQMSFFFNEYETDLYRVSHIELYKINWGFLESPDFEHLPDFWTGSYVK